MSNFGANSKQLWSSTGSLGAHFWGSWRSNSPATFGQLCCCWHNQPPSRPTVSRIWDHVGPLRMVALPLPRLTMRACRARMARTRRWAYCFATPLAHRWPAQAWRSPGEGMPQKDDPSSFGKLIVPRPFAVPGVPSLPTRSDTSVRTRACGCMSISGQSPPHPLMPPNPNTTPSRPAPKLALARSPTAPAETSGR